LQNAGRLKKKKGKKANNPGGEGEKPEQPGERPHPSVQKTRVIQKENEKRAIFCRGRGGEEKRGRGKKEPTRITKLRNKSQGRWERRRNVPGQFLELSGQPGPPSTGAIPTLKSQTT